MGGHGMIYREVGHERITVDTTVGGKGLTVPRSAVFARMRVKGDTGKGLCYRADGTAPTSSTGMEYAAGDVFWFDGELARFRAIRRDDADVTLVVVYYRPAG